MSNPGVDVLADWKTQRFVVADQTVHGYDNVIIVLCDIAYWTDYYDELSIWCNEHNARLAGVTIELHTQEQLTMFLLRWA